MVTDGVAMLPCPLCNVELLHNGASELGDIYEHPANGCAIQVAWFTATDKWISAWNRRRVPGNLTEHKLRQRAKSMLDAGHADDADLDIEAANAISTLERELEDARLAASGIEGVSNELDIALIAAKAEIDRLTPLAVAYDYLEAPVRGDMAHDALTAAEAKAARMGEALKAMLQRFELYAGPNDIHAGHHDIELLKRARSALQSEKDREGGE